MSAFRTRLGMPPHVRWDIVIESVVLVLVVAAILVLAWLAVDTMNRTQAVPNAAPISAANALIEQRRGEWNVNLSALTPAQRGLYEQRVGEWNTKAVIAPTQFDLNIERANIARSLGIR